MVNQNRAPRQLPTKMRFIHSGIEKSKIFLE
jgi:hypothetical protein